MLEKLKKLKVIFLLYLHHFNKKQNILVYLVFHIYIILIEIKK